MSGLKKLPEAEFEIMKAVWDCPSTVNSVTIMQLLNNDKKWKIQTVLTLLSRLVDRGFLRTEKHGRDRVYFPIVLEEDYLEFETDNFISRYHNNSVTSLVSTLYHGKNLERDVKELREWIDERGE